MHRADMSAHACALALILAGICMQGASGLVVPLPAARPATSLSGVSLPRVADGKEVDLGAAIAETGVGARTMVIFGTYPADFNCVEYMQKVRAFWPQLQAKKVERCLMVVNGKASSAAKLAEMLDMPSEIELLSDPTGEAGRRFGVSRGFRPDDSNIPAFLKLFVMGVVGGPGSWMTLPAVLVGYFGSPGGRREWIDSALKQGQIAGRWPDTLLELNAEGEIVANKFDTTPLVSNWGVRPFELATLRLQNLASLQLKNWDDLKYVDDRCLTQLGGCCVVGEGGNALFSWVDQGLCDVVDMHHVLEHI